MTIKRKWSLLVKILVVAVICSGVFIGGFYYGKYTVKPSDSVDYTVVENLKRQNDSLVNVMQQITKFPPEVNSVKASRTKVKAMKPIYNDDELLESLNWLSEVKLD